MIEEPAIEFAWAGTRPDWINAIGRFDEDSPQRFAAFLDEHREIGPGAMVQLASEGGSLMAGIEVGAMIQAHGFDTLVGNSTRLSGCPICSSACTLAFLGGIRRLVNPDASFRIHAPRPVRPDGGEFSLGEKVFSVEDLLDEQKLMSVVLRYVRNQGVDPLAVAAMYDVSPYSKAGTSIRILTAEELVIWRISDMESVPQRLEAELMVSDRLRRALCPVAELTDARSSNVP